MIQNEDSSVATRETRNTRQPIIIGGENTKGVTTLSTQDAKILSNIQSFNPKRSIPRDPDFEQIDGNLLMNDSIANSLERDFGELSNEDEPRENPHLKDFQEFLDPCVLEDEDFRMNEKIIKQLQDGYNQNKSAIVNNRTDGGYYGIPIINGGMPLPPPPAGYAYGYIHPLTASPSKRMKKPGKKQKIRKPDSGVYTEYANNGFMGVPNLGLIPQSAPSYSNWAPTDRDRSPNKSIQDSYQEDQLRTANRNTHGLFEKNSLHYEKKQQSNMTADKFYNKRVILSNTVRDNKISQISKGSETIGAGPYKPQNLPVIPTNHRYKPSQEFPKNVKFPNLQEIANIPMPMYVQKKDIYENKRPKSTKRSKQKAKSQFKTPVLTTKTPIKTPQPVKQQSYAPKYENLTLPDPKLMTPKQTTIKKELKKEDKTVSEANINKNSVLLLDTPISVKSPMLPNKNSLLLLDSIETSSKEELNTEISMFKKNLNNDSKIESMQKTAPQQIHSDLKTKGQVVYTISEQKEYNPYNITIKRNKSAPKRKKEEEVNTQMAMTDNSKKVKWKNVEHISKKEAIEKRIKQINKQLQKNYVVGDTSPYREKFSQTNKSVGFARENNSSMQSIADGGVQSELFRQKQRDKSRLRENKHVTLDPIHLEKVRDPKNLGDFQSFIVPEGMSPNPKIVLDGLSKKAKKLKKDFIYEGKLSQRSLSHASAGSYPEKIKDIGLSYKFKMRDINKYSQTLRPNDIKDWKFKLSALGKKIPDESERRRRLKKASYFNKLLNLLKTTDWSRTPIYFQFLRNGKWVHEDPKIYSEIEMKYLSSSLQAMINNENNKEFNEFEGQIILAKHSEKTMHTLEVLMNQMNMMFYYEKLRIYFKNVQLNMDQLSKLMQRCIKMYMMIDNFMKIFKLIEKKQKIEQKHLNDPSSESIISKLQFDPQLGKRIQVTICCLLKENPMLPSGCFKFNGLDLLEQLRAQEKVYKQSLKQWNQDIPAK